ncbi:N-acetyltransferase [bacterium]|nr:N-acetyltransferase [bacterium]
MKIRIAKPDDLTVIVDIYNQAIAAGQKTADITPVTVEDRKKWFVEHLPDKYPIYVAEKENTIVGYLTISPYRPGRQALRHTAEVSYYIHSAYQRQGIASRLLEYAIGMCHSLQIKTLFAILIDTNTASIRLMEKFGFERWGHMPRVADFDRIEVGHLYYGLRIGE